MPHPSTLALPEDLRDGSVQSLQRHQPLCCMVQTRLVALQVTFLHNKEGFLMEGADTATPPAECGPCEEFKGDTGGEKTLAVDQYEPYLCCHCIRSLTRHCSDFELHTTPSLMESKRARKKLQRVSPSNLGRSEHTAPHHSSQQAAASPTVSSGLCTSQRNS